MASSPVTATQAGTPHALRVGVFGGAFDPPHRAHRLLAEAALAQLPLDVLHILPTGQAWHKARALTAADHRLALCELAFGDLPRVRIDRREMDRQGPSYTVDTLGEIAREYPGARLFLLMGADQLLAFKRWVRWPEVLGLATLVVAARPVESAVGEATHPAQALDLSGVDLPFERLHMPLTPISATAVRAQSQHTREAAPADAVWVSEAVARYISQHSLYQNPS